MAIPSNVIIIILSSVVILSYVFNIISRRTNIPSVLLLIATGIGAQYITRHYGIPQQDVGKIVKILGAIGLLMIVLEAALDLKIDKSKVTLISSSFGTALFVFLISAFSIAFLFMHWLHQPFSNCFLYAVPMSIISSAIVIPSTSHLPERKKEFVIYESSFSDIIGILAFNYMLMQNLLSLKSAAIFTGNVLLAVIISALASVLLVFILTRIQIGLKFFLLFAVLSLIYASGELIHLPSLLVVLVFGLVLNNARTIFRGPLTRILPHPDIKPVVALLHTLTAETSFLIRTFFFIIFGYSIQPDVLVLPQVWQLGSLIVGVLLAARFVYLRFILKSDLFPELLLMPRGLITILLFYNIPAHRAMQDFNEGVLFFVVVVTSLLMMIGLLFTPKENRAIVEQPDRLV
jgi:Kef-type K+ transport system membrane component KefB